MEEQSSMHIIKRSDQWNDRAVRTMIIPRGCLCVELTPDRETKIKVGEGDKTYEQLPYIGVTVDISKYFTKEQVARLIRDTVEDIFNELNKRNKYVRLIGAPVARYDLLPKTGNTEGDIRFVTISDTKDPTSIYAEYIWFNNRWELIGAGTSNSDLSGYVTKEEFNRVVASVNHLNTEVNELQKLSHTHTNKTILDGTSATYTTEKDTKLAGIEEHANNYTLPNATRTQVGGVKIGEGLLIDAHAQLAVDPEFIEKQEYDDTEIKERLTALEEDSHTHDNKAILDETTASYTVEEKEKLASLENYTLPAASSDTLGGVKVGDGLTIDDDGVLSATGGGGQEYVAGDGISIDEGSSVTDVTSLAWEQGSINPGNGRPDDFTTTVIRSPMIEVGLTNMLNVSAQAIDDSDMRWEAAFYDSNSEFISMTTTWQTLSDEVICPGNAKYVIILLRKEAETEIDENSLKACEISWPIEIGKYVITNTGVTHAEMESSSVIITENGETKTLLTFGQDLDVTNGVVSIPDYHRLVLNVEE